jgi:hypothetical protein
MTAGHVLFTYIITTAVRVWVVNMQIAVFKRRQIRTGRTRMTFFFASKPYAHHIARRPVYCNDELMFTHINERIPGVYISIIFVYRKYNEMWSRLFLMAQLRIPVPLRTHYYYLLYGQ